MNNQKNNMPLVSTGGVQGTFQKNLTEIVHSNKGIFDPPLRQISGNDSVEPQEALKESGKPNEPGKPPGQPKPDSPIPEPIKKSGFTQPGDKPIQPADKPLRPVQKGEKASIGFKQESENREEEDVEEKGLNDVTGKQFNNREEDIENAPNERED